MTPGYGGQAGGIGGIDLLTAFTEPVQRLLHIDCVPVYDGVECQAERPKLFLLALAERAFDFATFPVINASPQSVSEFLTVQLHQNSPAECGVVDVVQDVERLDDAPELGESFGQGRRPILDLQHAHDACGFELAQLERPSQPDQVGPVLDDQTDIDGPVGDRAERAIIGVFIDAPEPGPADISKAGAEAITEQPEQAKDCIGIGSRVALLRGSQLI